MLDDEILIPRNYQVELMKIALKQNTIIYLPTGSGKTYIAILVLKHMSESLKLPYNSGGKITLILVNTIALVDQHAKYVRQHTTFKVGTYSGEMNLDFWSKEHWNKEFNEFQVIIMTSQILLNNLNNKFIDLTKINLIIFDECHRAVDDHSMRQIMKLFQNYTIQPRVLGLTATLLNRNCKLPSVMEEVRTLEVTYLSKVATVDELEHVIGHSTNPREEFEFFSNYNCSEIDNIVLNTLDKLTLNLKRFKIRSLSTKTTMEIDDIPNIKLLKRNEGLRKLINLIRDLSDHINVMGTFGGYKTCISHMVQIERLILYCQDVDLYNILKYVETDFGWCSDKLKQYMSKYDNKTKIYKFSSNKILKFIEIFKNYKNKSNEELCAIVFTQKRFTAKILYHILQYLTKYDQDFYNIRSNFIVGCNNNPYNDTRESLYITKKNKEIIDSFINKEINVLVSSNVLEEGVDIPKCTLVIKFDKALEYRSYIQSKGRARHKASLYYTLVETEMKNKFMNRIDEYRAIENNLNDFLIGKNLIRPEPLESEINEMYNKELFKPYFTNGPNSAQINMLSAIPLLCQYCSSLPADKYTTHAPDWYIEKTTINGQVLCRIIILLPIECPLIEPIYGPFVTSKKIAKRAAALNACIELHKCGELDDDLLLTRSVLSIDDSNFLFKHWPKIVEKAAGNGKKKRLHKKEIPNCLKGKITSNKQVYLHLIELKPNYSTSDDRNQIVHYNMLTNNLCFGFITPNQLPNLCNFPIYDSNGTIEIEIKMNIKILNLTNNEIIDLQKFHFLIFNDLLQIIKSFLTFDHTGDNSEMLLIVPIQRNNNDINIDYEIIKSNRHLKNKFKEPSIQERNNIQVNEENYLYKIVSPWYRSETPMYIVTSILSDKNPLSDFPNYEYSSFVDYYYEKHKLKIINLNQSLVLVKALSKRLNFIKPRGIEHKRKKLKRYEELEEYLIPELLIKQDFPSPLWIQSKCLPTILSRVIFLLKLEQLQKQIVNETDFQINSLMNCTSLKLDEHLLNYEPQINDEPKMDNIIVSIDESCNSNNQLLALDDSSFLSKQPINKDFTKKMLESEYPWRNIDEPIDINRELSVSVIDIAHYTKFVNQSVTTNERSLKNQLSPTNQEELPAITYNKDYIEKPIQILLKEFNGINISCPNLNEFYESFTTAKANDIINLERLETLGDSFLKFITSIYIILRFPKYNEGSATTLKGKLVSNKNLYYLAKEKNFGGILKNDFQPENDWLPSCYHIPLLICNKIINNELSINKLFNFIIPDDEQIHGNLSKNTIKMINECINEDDDDDNNCQDDQDSYSSMAEFLNCQYVGDKTIADTVEALLGSFLKTSGISGGIKLCEWLNLIPSTENLQKLLDSPSPNPIINENIKVRDIDSHLAQWEEFENRLGYHFNNRAYLLQALTHSTYTPNRITYSYERLEFLGDAILDFLITCHIYETCGKLNPGEVTDLRSALVNNNTFASFVVRCGFHKFLLMINAQLQHLIDKFVNYLEMKNYVIDDEVLILLEENDLNIADYIDVPKILGDVFEALAGAVYLDSGKNLQTVWNVFHRIMWREIELFSNNVPKNILRRLYECHTAYPVFGQTHEVLANKVMIPLEFMCEGRKKRVHGFGSNKNMAKKAAAKIALRALEK